MPAAPSPQELSERYREVLKDITRTYIASGEPVSSRSVAKLRGNALSSATIRNVMADLEDWGYLTQPHTSAGRVPTTTGYHTFVDSLMPNRSVPARARRYIREHLRGAQPEGEKLVAVATHLLTELSNQIGIVSGPVIGDMVLESLSFVRLAGCRVLCVLVSSTGVVENRVVETQRQIPRRELLRISNYLSDTFNGLTLRQIRSRLLAMMAEERAQLDRLLSDAIALAQQALESEERTEVLVEGTSVVLGQPELADIERVRKLLDTFTDKASLVRMLNQLIDGTGVKVVIGDESDLTAGLDFSLVATTYGSGESPLGTLAIFGPSRMEYQRIVPLVSFLGQALSQEIDRAGSEPGED